MANPIEPKTARGGEAITKNETARFAQPYDAIYVGAAGDVNILDENGNTTVYGAGIGTIIPVRAVAVLSTSTTATGIVGLRY